jgi:branched-chain amino acid transport system substrate-binding protein
MGAVADSSGVISNVKGHDLAQFKEMSTQVVVAPAEYESGEFIYPYERAK